jgi:hypothetical protein
MRPSPFVALNLLEGVVPMNDAEARRFEHNGHDFRFTYQKNYTFPPQK